MPDYSRWSVHLPRVAVPAPLRPWLQEPASLTARCQRYCHTFRVHLLRHELSQPLVQESTGNRTRGKSRQLAWVREVLLHCDGEPVIFAHTVLATPARGQLRQWLAGLGSRSLGSLLFKHKSFRRGAIEFLRLDARHPLYRQAENAMRQTAEKASLPPVLWARRSKHYLGTQHVTVVEVFLPTLLQLTMSP